MIMPTYYAPRDLAAEMGQSERTARRVFAEAGIKHYRRAWWRRDISDEWHKIDIEEVRKILYNPSPTRQFGRRRNRQPWLNPQQTSMFEELMAVP